MHKHGIPYNCIWRKGGHFPELQAMPLLPGGFLKFYIATGRLAEWPPEIPAALCRHSCLQMIEISCLQKVGLMQQPISLSSSWHCCTFITVSWQQSTQALSWMLTILIHTACRHFLRALQKWMSLSVLSAPRISDSNTNHVGFFFLHRESIINVILLKNHFYFFLDIDFFESYHIITHKNITIPSLHLLCRISLILSAGLTLSLGYFDVWGFFSAVYRTNGW